MIEQLTLKFLKDLKNNNNKEWFDKNRKSYEAAKQNFLELTTQVLAGISNKDESLQHLDPKKCIFRINRDVRFSKDKSPYKTNMGMSITKGGKSSINAGYYFHLEPSNCFIGGGLYMAMPEEVKKLRQEIDYCWNDFNKIITNKKFIATYKDLNKSKEFSLLRPPKGYEETNKAIEYLKLKSWIAGTTISDDILLDKNLSKKIISTFEIIKPLIEFINKAIDN